VYKYTECPQIVFKRAKLLKCNTNKKKDIKISKEKCT